LIINIRGTNGSGKTTVVKSFLKNYPTREIYGALGPKRPVAYEVTIKAKRPLYVIGPYVSSTGGLDALPYKIQETIDTLLTKYEKLGNLLFEGVVVSTTFGALGGWMAQRQDKVIVAYLDTPLEVCMNSLAARESVKRGTKNVLTKFKVIPRTQALMNAAGIRTETISRENAVERILGWLA
jgi:cytidylate kinase